jgi:hypothetical protein
MKKHKFDAAEIRIIALVVFSLLVLFLGIHGENKKLERLVQVEQRVTQAERKMVLLKTCFPEGVYNGFASPLCPEFKKTLTSEIKE